MTSSDSPTDRKTSSIRELARSVRARVSPPGLLILGMTIVLLAFHAWWLSRFRRGFPLDIDEAGYMRFGYEATTAVRADGLVGLWRAVQSQVGFGPLLGAVTVPLHFTVGDSISRTFLAEWPFFALLIASVYGIGRRLSGAWLGALAAFVVATVPVVIDFTRTYHFVIPSAALMAASLYTLLRSEGLTRRGWAVTWGVATGLMLLSRTMMIAFLPGILVAAAALAARRERRGIRLANVGLGIGSLAAVAALWYAKSLPTVTEYLTRFGYGDRSALSELSSPFSFSYWTHEAALAMRQSLLAPLTLVVTTGLAAWLGILAARIRGEGVRGSLGLVLRSDLLILAIPVLAGYMALSTSANDGTGFVVPLLPPLILVSIAALSRLPGVWFSRVLVGGFLAVAALGIASKSNVFPGVSGRGFLSVPFAGPVPLWDGTSVIGRYLEGSGYPLPADSEIPRLHRGWLPASNRIASVILSREEAGAVPLVTFASREPVFNTNTLSLAARVFFDRSLAMRQLEPSVSGGAEAAYRAQLEASVPGVGDYLLTGDRPPFEFPPSVDQAAVERIAEEEGFGLVLRLSLPDGRETRLWARPAGAA